jgi:hypothetical protein
VRCVWKETSQNHMLLEGTWLHCCEDVHVSVALPTAGSCTSHG